MIDFLEIDIYALVNTRSAEFAQKFLREFGESWEESSDEYLIPEFSSTPHTTFSKASAVMLWMQEHSTEPCGIYWTIPNEHSWQDMPRCAMVFYTDDGQMVLGLTCRVSEDNWDDESEMWLRQLKDFAQSEFGYIIGEEPPPRSAREFMEIVNRSQNS